MGNCTDNTGVSTDQVLNCSPFLHGLGSSLTADNSSLSSPKPWDLCYALTSLTVRLPVCQQKYREQLLSLTSTGMHSDAVRGLKKETA
ncbi:hypothetical protein ACOMHN_013171 [Nucella lapillus]